MKTTAAGSHASTGLSARQIAEATRGGGLTATEVVSVFSEQIQRREPDVEAWAFFDEDLCLAAARGLDAADDKGPLCGVPVGTKDVLDTCDMPTETGSHIYRGYRPTVDASSVSLFRSAGSVITGKTVTAEFAGIAPGDTKNPRDPARSPGGSSSGSAAAVAADMVPVSLGSQTGGSVLRPASYCGIVGFKPTFGLIDRTGLKPAADSFGTVGLLGRTIDDVELFYRVITNQPTHSVEAPAEPPVIGVCRTHLWHTVGAEIVEAVDRVSAALTEAGARIDDQDFPDGFDEVSAARDLANDVERFKSTAFEYHGHPDLISAEMTAVVEHGQTVSYAKYLEALASLTVLRGRLDELFGDCDVLLAPCVQGDAPEELSSTGDPALQAIWTALGVPAVSLPLHRVPSGLPVGVQLVGKPRRDNELLATAKWVTTRVP